MTMDTPKPEERLILRDIIEIAKQIDSRLPELNEMLNAVAGQTAVFIRQAHGAYRGGIGGEPVLLSQALNDFLDTLFDASAGRGRSALRSARGLFELLVAAKDVFHDLASETRYAAHEVVVAQLEARIDTVTKELGGKARKSDEHRRKKLSRDTLDRYQSAINTYGKKFQSTWASMDLASRATTHGLQDEYDFYRLSSAVLHGSSGGALGIKKTVGNEIIHRTGPALQLCPIALLQALRFFDAIVAEYTKRHPEAKGVCSDLRASLKEARKLWPDYYEVMYGLDKEFWPDTPPPNLQGLLVISSFPRTKTWYIHDVQAGLVRLAEPPLRIESDQQMSLDAVTKYIFDTQPMSGEMISIGVFGVTLTPKKGTAWQDERLILSHATPFRGDLAGPLNQ